MRILLRYSIALLFLFLLSLTARAQKMEYVKICDERGNCRQVSRLVLGTDHLIQGDWTGRGEPELTKEQAFQVLDAASRAGINFFDSSPIYVGGVEYTLGEWRESRAPLVVNSDWYANAQLNPDRKLYLLSKGGFPFDLSWSKTLEPGSYSPTFIQSLARQKILNERLSLPLQGPVALQNVPSGTYASRLYGGSPEIAARIGVELGHSRGNAHGIVDFWLMHRDDGDAIGFGAVRRPQTAVAAILSALADPSLRPNYGVLGWSNWEPARIEESLRLHDQNPSLPRPVLNSPYFSLFEMSERTIHALGVQVTHDQMMNPNFLRGIKIMPYSPLGGFSILDREEPAWETAKAAARAKYEKGDPYWQNVFHSIFTPENDRRFQRVLALTIAYNAEHGTRYTVDQMVNAYALAHPRTDLLAIGAITPEQVARSIGALELSKKFAPHFLEYLHRGTAHAEIDAMLERHRLEITCAKGFRLQ